MNKFNRGGVRESNLELLRIVAMVLVVCLHANYYSLGQVSRAEVAVAWMPALVRMYLQLLCIVAVNVFVIISGWFGIKPTLRGAASLLFQTFFFGIVICGVVYALGYPIDWAGVRKLFHLGAAYWFIASYLVLYTIAPALNIFAEQVPPKTIVAVLLGFFVLEFAYGWLTNYADFDFGYSTISFVGLYLLARYLRLYPTKLTKLRPSVSLLLYLTTSLVPVLIFVLTGYYLGMESYSSPFVIASALFLFLTFRGLKIQSSVINYIASSIFVLYLAHQHPLVVGHFIDTMRWGYTSLTGVGYIGFVLAVTLAIAVVGVPLDKLRIALWDWICRAGLDSLMARLSGVASWVTARLATK